jgi:hypothetical protein
LVRLASLVTNLAYVLVLSGAHSQLRADDAFNVLQAMFFQPPTVALAGFIAWHRSAIYLDVNLWLCRRVQKDASAVELSMYAAAEGGGESSPVSRRRKWLLYPFYVVLLALAWHFVLYPPSNAGPHGN